MADSTEVDGGQPASPQAKSKLSLSFSAFSLLSGETTVTIRENRVLCLWLCQRHRNVTRQQADFLDCACPLGLLCDMWVYELRLPRIVTGGLNQNPDGHSGGSISAWTSLTTSVGATFTVRFSNHVPWVLELTISKSALGGFSLSLNYANWTHDPLHGLAQRTSSSDFGGQMQSRWGSDGSSPKTTYWVKFLPEKNFISYAKNLQAGLQPV